MSTGGVLPGGSIVARAARGPLLALSLCPLAQQWSRSHPMWHGWGCMCLPIGSTTTMPSARWWPSSCKPQKPISRRTETMTLPCCIIGSRLFYGCVPPFTHPVTQRVEGLSLENPQHPEKGTLSPDRSECSAVGLRQTGSHHGFSPAVGADASLTPSWTHAGACPGLFSADIAKLDPSDHQRIGESYPDAGHPELGYPVSAVAVEAWHALHCAHSQRYSPAAG